jgi:diadenosine tetraphosphate (Ap4A) HIT family hydrolase
MTKTPTCDLCQHDGGIILVKNDIYRIVRVVDPNYPAYLRVILNEHVREMTDLPRTTQSQLFLAVLACERVLRDTVSAYKVNLASLGNLTPHVHWHIIARYPDDPHFPDATWAVAKRAAGVRPELPSDEALAAALLQELER